ncbi:protein kinase [Nocardiopsis exhalans]|uniref:non-specific serine/threonine protein kinase n=1 Tax=Nocardiopsis exhalans TaxID=163604 RepID=A0ABY5DDU5_9ACTN|nr:protein kinase [Nocardiopsis exhalans]
MIRSRGVIHRDFKPANILLPPEAPRVIDFGISRFLGATSVTPSGLLGTRGYAAPEQLQNAPLSTAVDVFAWGCVMVFAATKRSPFPAGNGEAWREQVLHGSPETGATREPLLRIVLYCLHKDPAQRPTARDLMDRLVETHSAG